MARPKLGQHFLADETWRERIAREIGASRYAGFAPAPANPLPWIEIGAGHGEMTEHLLSTSAPVTAIELDAALAANLSALARRYPTLKVVAGDILQLDLSEILGAGRCRVYGNLPYYITSPILHRLFEHAARIAEIHIVIQLEVAARLAARPATRDYGYLSVLTQFFSRPEIVLCIPRAAFRPPPKVSSALVTLRLPGAAPRLSVPDETRFLDFAKLCFAHKRKTLANNLKSCARAEAVRRALAAAGLRPDARAEQLSLDEFARLHELLVPFQLVAGKQG